jgi:hypothetical protein
MVVEGSFNEHLVRYSALFRLENIANYIKKTDRAEDLIPAIANWMRKQNL